ncbi:NFACT family protein, partial [bacterium]|nr:NFACT family protein [bacterium]
METLALSRAVREAALAAEDELDQGDRRGALLKTALAAEKRARGLVAKLEKEREEAREAEEIRQRGELLKANASRVKRGQTKITVQDYFSQEPREVEIEIDPLLPVMDQARALFKRAKKLDRGLVAIETRLGETDAQAEAIAKVRSELEASSPEDEAALDRAERALEKLGLKLVR